MVARRRWSEPLRSKPRHRGGCSVLCRSTGAVHAFAALREQHIQSIAVSLIHAIGAEARASHRRNLHEECPDLYVSLSHQVCPEIREYERTSTTVANATSSR